MELGWGGSVVVEVAGDVGPSGWEVGDVAFGVGLVLCVGAFVFSKTMINNISRGTTSG